MLIHNKAHKFVLLVLLLFVSAREARGQETIERSLNLSGGWVGYTGMFYANLPYRFTTSRGPGTNIIGFPTFDLSLGIPLNSLVGVRFAHQSPTVPGRPNEWEILGRHSPLSLAHGAPLDLAVSAGFNGAARSIDGEVSAARWMGPLRVLGAARAMSSAYGTGTPRVAIAAGGVLHPLPGSAPIGLFADAGTLLARDPGESLAWSAGIQVGVSFTDLTASLFATNTLTSTLQGASAGTGRVRFGFELTVPIPVGRFIGWNVPRPQAMEAVVATPEPSGRVVQAQIERYLFAPKRIEISAGTTIEWTNNDSMMHTVTSDDGAWDSGAIQPGRTWSARFNQPGRYAFHCSPHPFMKGIVIVNQ